MSTQIVLDGGAQGQASDGLDRFAEYLYDNPGTKLMAVVEFAVTKLEEPGPMIQKDRKVRIGLVGCEVGSGDQEHTLRTAQRALWLHRSATGTLTEEGDLQYSQAVLDSLDGHLDASEAVRFRAALDWLVSQLADLARNSRLDDGNMRREVKKLATVGRGALAGQQLRLDDKTVATAELIAAERAIAEEDAAAVAAAQDRLDATTDPSAEDGAAEGLDAEDAGVTS